MPPAKPDRTILILTVMSTPVSVCLICTLLFVSFAPAEAQILTRLKEAVEDVVEETLETSGEGAAPCVPAAPASVQGIIYSEDFENGSFGGEMWAARPGESGVVRVVDRLPDVQNISYSGDFALAIGREGDTYFDGTPRENTVSAADLCLDLSGQEEASLHFYIRDQADENTASDAILLSDDGGRTFHVALRLQPYSWGNDSYGAISLDLAAAARQLRLSLSDHFVVRFQQGGVADFAGNSVQSRDGFFIDNVVVMGEPAYAQPPFSDGFEAGTLGPSWRAADPFRKGETALELQAQWGFVEPVQRLADVPPVPRSGDYALAMGRPIGGDGRFMRVASVNAADLHLDLAGREEATLRFYLRDERDESDEADGVFLSDDGGLHFTKALDLGLENRPDGEYSEVVLDLAETASQLGLALTDRFIVRIQQSGSADFAGGSRQTSDGFLVDDLTVETVLTPKEEVLARIESELREWRQRGKYEKSEDYEERLNEGEPAAKDSLTQVALIEVAESRIDWSAARTEYNADTEAFIIAVEHLHPFTLAVPIGEAEAFDENLNSLVYQNPVYALGQGDALEVVYVEVTNPAVEQTYILDSRQ